MSDPVVNLTPVAEHLSAQLDSVSEIRRLLAVQEQAIGTEDVTAILDASTLLHAQMTRRSQLEDEREVLLAGLGMRLGCPADQVTAARLAACDDSGLGEQVRSMSEQLAADVLACQSEHDRVQQLLRSELAFVAHLLDALAPAAKPAAAYGPDGQKPQAPGRSSLNLHG